MTAGAPIELRRIIARATELTGVRPRKRVHALGLGLPHDLQFSIAGEPAVRLPGFAAGLAQVASVIGEPPRVEGLDDSLAPAAWAALFAHATVIPLRAPTDDDLMTDSILPPQSSAGRLRSLALAAVVRPPTMRVEGGSLLDGPHAAVARLTVMSRVAKPTAADYAWLRVEWTGSSTTLARELEYLCGRVRTAEATSRSLKPLAIVVGDSMDSIVDQYGPHLRAVGFVHGYRVRLLRRPRAHGGSIASGLLADQPSLVAIAAGPEDATAALVSQYRAKAARPRVVSIDIRGGGVNCVADLRDTLCSLAEIGPALTLMAPEVPVLESAELGAGVRVLNMLVPDEARLKVLRHPKWGRYFLSTDGMWYTVDHAGHGGCVVKCYKQINRTLYHEHDFDEDGHIMAKHKGVEGAVIDLDEMFGRD